MDERLLAIIPLAMLVGLIRHMAVAIIKDNVAQQCQTIFGFYPEGNLSREDRQKIYNVMSARRAEYEEACSLELMYFDPHAEGSARLTFENDIELAAQKLSDAYGLAKRVCKRYGQRQNRRNLLRKLTELAYPEMV